MTPGQRLAKVAFASSGVLSELEKGNEVTRSKTEEKIRATPGNLEAQIRGKESLCGR